MLTKLRPYFRFFLEEADDMFEMYIYTMGGWEYADQIAELLKPDGMYFPFRLLVGPMAPQATKALDIVFGPENVVIILDDSENVSSNHHFIVSFC
jgi:TFIIF-interacting CTD phosphatase-like protein